MILNFTLNLGTKKKIKTKHVFIDINCMEKIETKENELWKIQKY